MTLSNGRQYLAIPGPSVMPDRVLRAMHRAAPNIYHGELVELVPELVAGLKTVARTSHQAAIYICNGHGSWEAALANVLSRGDRVLVLATGSFAYGWGEVAEGLGGVVEVMDFGRTGGIDTARVSERLVADKAHEIKAVLAVHVDTGSSLRSDIAAVRVAIDEAGHPALLMVDCIASLACERFEMDTWGVDVMVTGSQKGLMTPPGIAFVFYNDRADAVRESAGCASRYWDWRTRTEPDLFYHYFYGTPPTQHLYGLKEALAMIAEEGLEAVWRRHEILAQAVWAAFEHWGGNGPLRLNISDPSLRAHSVTAVVAGSEKGTALRRWCEERAGLTLGIGLGAAAFGAPELDHHFRVGHMGHLSAQMILGALGTIEAGLTAVGIGHRPGGVVAAADVIAAAA